MRMLFCGLTVLALAACGEGERTYEMSVADARGKMLGANFERGVLPGSTIFKPKVRKLEDGSVEWQVLDNSQNGSGWWCPLSIDPVGEDGKRVKVVNQCQGIMASRRNANLDELVDATLSGRPPKFD